MRKSRQRQSKLVPEARVINSELDLGNKQGEEPRTVSPRPQMHGPSPRVSRLQSRIAATRSNTTLQSAEFLMCECQRWKKRKQKSSRRSRSASSRSSRRRTTRTTSPPATTSTTTTRTSPSTTTTPTAGRVSARTRRTQ
jgi:hypothetical protein